MGLGSSGSPAALRHPVPQVTAASARAAPALPQAWVEWPIPGPVPEAATSQGPAVSQGAVAPGRYLALAGRWIPGRAGAVLVLVAAGRWIPEQAAAEATPAVPVGPAAVSPSFVRPS